MTSVAAGNEFAMMLAAFETRARTETKAGYLRSGLERETQLGLSGQFEAVPSVEVLTYFHSRVLPGASLRSLAASIVRAGVAVDVTTVAIAIVLMVRFRDRHPHPVTAHMMHRLFVACVLGAAKAHQDKFPCNKLLGTAVGVKSSEMNRIEWAIITALDWRLVVTQQDVNEAVVSLTPPCASFAESSSGDSVYVPCDDRRDVLSDACRAVGSSSTSPTRHRNADQHDVSCA